MHSQMDRQGEGFKEEVPDLVTATEFNVGPYLDGVPTLQQRVEELGDRDR